MKGRSHYAISRLLVSCPGAPMDRKEPARQNQDQTRKALIIGLFVGASCFTIAFISTRDISFSLIFSVVTGIFATCFSRRCLQRQVIHEDLNTSIGDIKKCPAAKRLLDEGYYGPKSITWRTGADPALFIAGLAACLTQMLHPDVIDLIQESGKFYKDPMARANRTKLYHHSTIYGDKETAQKSKKTWILMHDALRAKDPITGKEYCARRPDLVLWVLNSTTWMTLQAFKQTGLILTSEEEDKYVREQHIAAALVDLEVATLPDTELPSNTKQLNDYMKKMLDKLRLTEGSKRFHDFFIKKGFPCSLRAVISHLLAGSCLRLMLPEHQQLFGYKRFSKSSDITVQVINMMIRMIRYGFPAAKIIQEIRDDLVENSFGAVVSGPIMRTN